MQKSYFERNNEVIVFIPKYLKFLADSTDIVSTAKPTQDCCVTYVFLDSTMSTAKYLFYTGPDVNLIRSSMMFPSWTSSIKRKTGPQLQTVTWQLLFPDKLTLIHLRLDHTSTNIRTMVASHQRIKALLGTLLNACFVRGISRLERIVVLWSPQSVEIQAYTRTLQDARMSNNFSPSPAQAIDQNLYHEAV